MLKYAGEADSLQGNEARATGSVARCRTPGSRVKPISVSPDSSLRRLPANLDPTQKFLLDGIRLSAEFADFHWGRLQTTALDASVADPGGCAPFVVALYADAWAVVDNVRRLRRLLHALAGPELPPIAASFRADTKAVEDLRNTIQHPERIAKREPVAAPPLGALTWVFTADGTRPERSVFIAMAGTARVGEGTVGLEVGSLAVKAEVPIGSVILWAQEPRHGDAAKTTGSAMHTTSGSDEIAVSLSETMERVREITAALDRCLKPQIAAHGVAGTDLVVRLELQLRRPDSG